MFDPPRCALGMWPTPVRRLEHVSAALGVEIWVKLEEECGAWGGNKVRKLEYILGRARSDGIHRLTGFGVATSNWTSALAFHAAREGFQISLRLAGDPSAGYEALYAAYDIPVKRIPPPALALYALRSRFGSDRNGARLLPAGGSGGEGDVGSLNAGREIAAAVLAGELPAPHRIFVAAGTGGTAAGIALGAAAGGLETSTVCVRVTARPYGTVRLVRRRLAGLRTTARLEAAPLAPVVGDDRFFRPGYGSPNPASVEATALARADGIELDGTYAAKAFASLIDHARSARRGPLLFVHTSPGPVPLP